MDTEPTKEMLTEVPTDEVKGTLLTEVPTDNEGELLTEAKKSKKAPKEPKTPKAPKKTKTVLATLADAVEKVVDVIVPDVIQSIPADVVEVINTVVASENVVDKVRELTPKQRKKLLQNYSKRTLLTRFGIRL